MDFNALKKKYLPDAVNESPEQFPEPIPEEGAGETDVFPEIGETFEIPPVIPEPVTDTKVSGTRGNTALPVFVPETESGQDAGGFFGEETAVTYTDHETRRRNHVRWPIRMSMDQVAALPWVDIIMILLTVIGIIWVIANFDAVTVIIAAAIGKLIQSLIGLLMIAALILGLILLTRRRRRFFW